MFKLGFGIVMGVVALTGAFAIGAVGGFAGGIVCAVKIGENKSKNDNESEED